MESNLKAGPLTRGVGKWLLFIKSPFSFSLKCVYFFGKACWLFLMSLWTAEWISASEESTTTLFWFQNILFGDEYGSFQTCHLNRLFLTSSLCWCPSFFLINYQLPGSKLRSKKIFAWILKVSIGVTSTHKNCIGSVGQPWPVT
jgi:hypothetical protein